MKLAEALLRRKELAAKVAQLQTIKGDQVFQMVVSRKNVTDSVDDITAKVPKLTASQVTAEFDHYSRQLRLIDAAIQQCNWTVDVPINDGDVLKSFTEASEASAKKEAGAVATT
jgi:hypothetical protein